MASEGSPDPTAVSEPPAAAARRSEADVSPASASASDPAPGEGATSDPPLQAPVEAQAAATAVPAASGTPAPVRRAPSGRGQGPASGRPRQLVVGVAAVLVVVLVSLVAAALPGGDDDPSDNASAEDDDSAVDTTAADATTTTESVVPPTTPAPAPTPGALPPGWTLFTDPQGTYTIGLPPGWHVQPTSESYRIDLVDPATDSLLRVEWTGSPRPDAVQAWRDSEGGFAARHPGYQQISISRADYRDYPAALWEFRHGTDPSYHTGNLGFITHGRGYALMFRTPEAQWAAGQPTFEQFQQTFQPT